MVEFDHCYSRAWNWRPDSTGKNMAARTILVPRVNRNSFRIAYASK